VTPVQECYRHPGRETGVSCSACGKPICPACMTSTSVGMRCPDCAGERTKVHTAQSIATGAEPRATYALIAINVVAFMIEAASGAGSVAFGGTGGLVANLAVYGPGIAVGEWWRIVTGGFLHAGILHLGLNMLVLWILGRLLEPAIGTPKFLGVYFAALLAGSFGALLLTPDSPTVGASGAIYGLMGATIVVARERGVQRIAQEIGIWLVLNIVITFSVSGISIGGHLGGLAAGVICGFAVSRLPEQGQWLALSGVAVASVVGSLLSAGAL